ncbi:MAG: response regulator [Myxococcales bacterium]|nr:response regulator [Myxococcales bacterium]
MVEAAPDTRPVILYVEDDADTFRLAHLRLQQKYRLLHAATDREACAQLEVWGEKLYAVLMDLELQGSLLDGLALVRLIRGQLPAGQSPPYARRVPALSVPVLVLTASTARHTEAEARAMGATHFATKPIDFARLNLALAQVNIQSVMARLTTKAVVAR